MVLIHIVHVKFTPETSGEKIKRTIEHMEKLKGTCLHPKTGAPYILSLKGGIDNSKEGLQGGFTHTFVLEFESIDDRDYYVSEDPAHQEFIKAVQEIPLGGVQVLDFIVGSY